MTENLPINTQQLITIFAKANRGLKIGEIEAMLSVAISRRTLQRRLTEMQETGLIEAHGIKSATEYSLKNVKVDIPFSKSAVQLKLKIRQPETQRKPVGYNTEFLFSYHSNKTFYLSEKIRAHLLEVGKRFHQKLEPGTYAKRILQRLLIDLSWNSSRLEGNTYSLLETERLIEYGAEAAGKDAFEAQMILNHKEAIEFMVEQVAHTGLNKYIVFNIHALLSNNLLPNPRARGRLRQIPVGIGKTVYHPPEIPQVIEDCFQAIIDAGSKIQDPFEQAFFLMVQLPYLQPFEDVNKRVSRLVTNIPLMRNNLSPLSFIDVPKDDYISGLLGVYELNNVSLLRDLFVWAYERSAQHYQVIQETLTDPNRIVMRYREVLFNLVNHIVMHRIKGKEILSTINEWTTKQVDRSHRKEFALCAEKEIAGLHDGNIAVYHISPEAFVRWGGRK